MGQKPEVSRETGSAQLGEGGAVQLALESRFLGHWLNVARVHVICIRPGDGRWEMALCCAGQKDFVDSNLRPCPQPQIVKTTILAFRPRTQASRPHSTNFNSDTAN